MQIWVDKYLAVVFSAVSVFALSFHIVPYVKESVSPLVASVFFQNSIETADIIAQYAEATTPQATTTDRVKIIIVPGHDDTYSGAQFGTTREADLVLKLGIRLTELLSKEEGLEVFLTRDKSGYNPILKEFFKKEGNAVLSFKEEKIQTMNRLISEGKVESYVKVQHNTARPEVSAILYGINKFANDNKYDIVLHIHFNDYPGRTGLGGKYSGFSIYVPEGQYSNAAASYDFAEKLRDQFLRISAESDLLNEEAITEDQELIAIGRYNSLDSAAALVEYGYIYESQFTDPAIGDAVREEFAVQTYEGIMQYLKNATTTNDTSFRAFDTYTWNRDLTAGDRGLDVLALQDRLRDLGYYPLGKNLNTCPLSGRFGGCTQSALIAYQRDNGINATGFFGEVTRGKFNAEQ